MKLTDAERELTIFWRAVSDEQRGDLPAIDPDDALEKYVAARVTAALDEAADFISDTSGIGSRANDYADGWYAARDYAIAELRSRAAIPTDSAIAGAP